MCDFRNSNWGDSFEKVKSLVELEDGFISAEKNLGNERGHICCNTIYCEKQSLVDYWFLNNIFTDVSVSFTNENTSPRKYITDYLDIANELSEIFGEPTFGYTDRPVRFITYLDEKKYNTGLIGWSQALMDGLVTFHCAWENSRTDAFLLLRCNDDNIIKMDLLYRGKEYKAILKKYFNS